MSEMDEFWSDVDEAVRKARHYFERMVPGQCAVGHNGHQLVIAHAGREQPIDLYGFLQARDPRDICWIVIKRLGLFKAAA